jgi:hypothetical protein
VRGHFRGSAAIGDATYYVDALITVDGDVRMHVAGPFDEGTVFSGGGFPEASDFAESVLFVGNLETIGDENLGRGVVLGQACAPANPGRFCDVPAPASISVEGRAPLPDSGGLYGTIVGEIRVATSAAEESWRLDLSWRSGGNHFFGFDPYRQSAYGGPIGQFLESLAGFAQADDTIVTIDAAGRLFFPKPGIGVRRQWRVGAPPAVLRVRRLRVRRASAHRDLQGELRVAERRIRRASHDNSGQR